MTTELCFPYNKAITDFVLQMYLIRKANLPCFWYVVYRSR